MKRRYDVNHIGIHCRIMFGEFYALLNDHSDMALLMRHVEGGIAGDYLILNIVDDLLRHLLQFQFGNFAPFPFLFQNLAAMRPFLRHTFLADMPGMTFARKLFIGEIQSALPTVMAHLYRF